MHACMRGRGLEEHVGRGLCLSLKRTSGTSAVLACLVGWLRSSSCAVLRFFSCGRQQHARMEGQTRMRSLHSCTHAWSPPPVHGGATHLFHSLPLLLLPDLLQLGRLELGLGDELLVRRPCLLPLLLHLLLHRLEGRERHGCKALGRCCAKNEKWVCTARRVLARSPQLPDVVMLVARRGKASIEALMSEEGGMAKVGQIAEGSAWCITSSLAPSLPIAFQPCHPSSSAQSLSSLAACSKGPAEERPGNQRLEPACTH
jgi:hypothetical protein